MVKKYWYQKHLLNSRSSVIVISPKLDAFGEDDFHDVPSSELEDDLENIAVETISQLIKKSESKTMPRSQCLENLEFIYNAYIFDEFSIPFMKQRKLTFLDSWHSTNLGEDVMGDYIEFCRSKTALPARWLAMAHKIFRERYMKTTFNIDIIKDVPDASLLRVLGDRLHLTNILPWFVNLSSRGSEEECKFTQGHQDMVQWKERDQGVEGIRALELVGMLVPNCSDARTAFKDLTEMLVVHKSNIFVDMSVHLLMVVLVIFDSKDADPHIRHVHKVAADMLQRHLKMVSQQPAVDLHLVRSCVAAVPAITAQLARVFTV